MRQILSYHQVKRGNCLVGDDIVMVKPKSEVGSSGCKSRIVALFCFVQSILLRKHLWLPSWGQSMSVRATGSANAFIVIFESGFLPLATSTVVPPLFPSYFPGGSEVVYMHCGKYLSFLVLEICSSYPLLVASFNERFKHN